jgi:shikimate dehydrogenase
MTALGMLEKKQISYRTCDVVPGKLALAVSLLRHCGARGFNVTVPHKRTVIPHLDDLSYEAARIGAVNAVRCAQGRLLGHNTDAAGFCEAIKDAGFAPEGREAVVFGAGGAARAAAFSLARLGARAIRITTRRPGPALALIRDLAPGFPKTVFQTGPAGPAYLAVNATPLGLPGYPDRSPAPAGWPGCRAALDLVYGRRTAFQRQALRLGARTQGGTGMLVCQALQAWEFWFGPLPRKRRQAWKEFILEGISCALDS